jgi:membrane dipeptidase
MASTTTRSVPDVSESAHALHGRSIVIDGCSFFLRGYNDRVRDGGLTAINFTVPWPTDDLALAFNRVREYHDIARRDPKVEIAWSVEVIEHCKREGKLAAILGCQNTRFLGTEYANVELFARLGLRVAQLTYNERNFAGDGCLEPANGGLSFFGRGLIRELNNWGVVLDLSHCGVRTSLEAIEASSQPVIISHIGMGGRVASPRSASDDQIKAIAGSGGVVGVTSFAPMNWNGGQLRPHIQDLLDNIEYAIGVAGIDHVGIGTDHVVEPGGYPQAVRDHAASQYGPYDPSNSARASKLFGEVMAGISRDDQLEGFSGMQHFPRLTQGLLDRGYAESDVQKVIGGNFLRVFRTVWPQVVGGGEFAGRRTEVDQAH